jgi:hypothetical protein
MHLPLIESLFLNVRRRPPFESGAGFALCVLSRSFFGPDLRSTSHCGSLIYQFPS